MLIPFWLTQILRDKHSIIVMFKISKSVFEALAKKIQMPRHRGQQLNPRIFALTYTKTYKILLWRLVSSKPIVRLLIKRLKTYPEEK